MALGYDGRNRLRGLLDHRVARLIINYGAAATVFMDGLVFHYGCGDFRLAYIIMAVILAGICLSARKLLFEPVFSAAFGLLSFFSLLNVVLGHVILWSSVRQIGIISFNAVFYYAVVRYNRKDIMRLFSAYLHLGLLASLIAVLQEVGFLSNVKALYDFSPWLPNWRFSMRYVGKFLSVNSVMPEPTSFCLAIFPAVAYSFIALTARGRVRVNIPLAVFIFAGFIFSFSSLGFLGFLFIILLLAMRSLRMKKWLAASAVIVLLAGGLYSWVPSFKVRLDDTMNVLTRSRTLDDVNLSTFTLMNNAYITREVFARSPVWGYGLGSHEYSFERFNEYQPLTNRPLLNRKDGNSLFLRLVSETGLLGLGLFLWFLYSFCLLRRRDIGVSGFWALNISVLGYMFMRLVRQGHYFSEGFFLFFWLYYFSYRAAISGRQARK